MSKILKNNTIFEITLMTLVIFFSFFSIQKAEASTVTASVTGNWSDTATWGGSPIPTSSDDVVVNDGITVMVDITAVALSVTINAPTTSNGITISGTNTLTVGTFVTLNAPTVNSTSDTINIGTGILNVGTNMTVTGGGVTARDSIVTISTGTLNVTGNLTLTGSASTLSKLVSTGTSIINIGGNFPNGGTFTAGSSTVTFNGSGSQSVNSLTYNNLVIAKSAGIATAAGGGTMIIGGTLDINGGTFEFTSATANSTFNGTTTIANGATILFPNSIAGTKLFNGDVIINPGGTWREIAGTSVTHAGNFVNNGSFIYISSVGVHTFSGVGKSISGANPVAMPRLTVTGTITNNTTLTVSAALAGTGTITNGATGILNIGGTSAAFTLVATAVSNSVNYTGIGQTVKPVSYYNLNLSGASGTTTIASSIAVASELSVGSGIILNLTGASTTGFLKLGGIDQPASSYGATGSGATTINDTYFSGSGTITAPNTLIPPPSSHHSSSWNITEVVPVNTTPANIITVTVPVVPPPDISLMLYENVNPKSRKTLVRTLQSALNKSLGPIIIPLAIDGQWGRMTTAVIIEFQSWNGLMTDSRVGPLTRAKLNASTSAR